MLRGDKGLKKTADLTHTQYLMRGLKLASPHIPLFMLALFCLTCQSLTTSSCPESWAGRG